jgi:hypothetical protein
MRNRKPCVLCRRRLLGWNVRFMRRSPGQSLVFAVVTSATSMRSATPCTRAKPWTDAWAYGNRREHASGVRGSAPRCNNGLDMARAFSEHISPVQSDRLTVRGSLARGQTAPRQLYRPVPNALLEPGSRPRAGRLAWSGPAWRPTVAAGPERRNTPDCSLCGRMSTGHAGTGPNFSTYRYGSAMVGCAIRTSGTVRLVSDYI